jgi:hypothetical protein
VTKERNRFALVGDRLQEFGLDPRVGPGRKIGMKPIQARTIDTPSATAAERARERDAVAESNSREVTHVARRQPTDAQPLGQRHGGCVDQTQSEVREPAVDLHRAR